ncbi:MAG: sugar kinase [Gemmatimonadaceae bacterium]|jgi:2-dehydro-3-deoxygluconokinase|nr:sugar kinase [Gemmatimonadaceae bacterium]
MTGSPDTVLTFGELLLRLSPPGDERLLQSATLSATFGGCEANVAVGLAQFGVPSRYVSCVPTNAIGDAACRALRAEGVNVDAMLRRDARLGMYFLERGSGLRALRTVYDRAHSGFAQISADDLHVDAWLAGVTWVHSSGIVPALGAGPAEALHALFASARARGVRTSLDCNYRPALWQGRDPQPMITPLASAVDVLIGNPDAFRIMLGVETRGAMPEPPEALFETARALHARWGISHVAITQREVHDASTHGWRAWLWHVADDRLHDGGSYTVRVVDRVGGGDAFAAGLLTMLHEGVEAAQAIRFATAAGAHKLTVPGDWPRTTRTEIAALAQGAHVRTSLA